MNSRRTFGPVVLVGLAAAGLSTVAGNQECATVGRGDNGDPHPVATMVQGAQLPLAAALGLVVLAAWGVALVTRGRVRRGAAGLGTVASAGLLATVVRGFWTLKQAIRDDAAEIGVTVPAELTGWYYAALVGAVLSLVATLAAVKLTPHWPEMGSRYDAPGAAEPASVPPEERSSLDLWRSLDEGQDPTE